MKGKDIGNICLNCKKPILQFHKNAKPSKFHDGCKREYLKQTSKCVCGCGETIPKFTHDLKTQKYKHGHHVRIENPLFWGGENHWAWKGGIRYHGNGYRYIWNPKHHFAIKEGYVLEHRLVWEEYHKAILLPWADVHHKNKDILDNRIENLQAMMNGEHSRYHRLEESKMGISNRTKYKH